MKSKIIVTLGILALAIAGAAQARPNPINEYANSPWIKGHAKFKPLPINEYRVNLNHSVR